MCGRIATNNVVSPRGICSVVEALVASHDARESIQSCKHSAALSLTSSSVEIEFKNASIDAEVKGRKRVTDQVRKMRSLERIQQLWQRLGHKRYLEVPT